MKYLSVVFFALTAMLMLAGSGVMAEPGFMLDVNSACGEIAVECSSCHNLDDFDQYTDNQGIYESSGACAFCSPVASCSPVRPTRDELLIDAQTVTNQYFERLFREFSEHLQQAGGNFATVFPDCPEIAPLIGSEFSRDNGYLVRRVTNRTRNARNTPDKWEAKQLEEFEKMAKDGKPRTEFLITKPDNTDMLTKEFEAYGFVNEEDVEYFRYMRSITLPGLDKLPCLKCHGTFEDLAPDLIGKVEQDENGIDFYKKGVLEESYPYDMALGYKAGDIRGAWTIKIPIVEGEDD